LISTAALTVYHEFQGDNEFVVTGKLKDFDIRDQIKNITVPTLLTFGEHETMPLKAAQRMAEDIPHARLVTTPNAGHHHMIDNPDVYFAHLSQFISDVEAGSFDA
jgi:proline iminopeptidase